MRRRDYVIGLLLAAAAQSPVFRQFRDTTPLAALHAIRLEQAHDELGHSVTGASIGEISRRYGFTNPGRFAAVFG